MNEVLPIGRLHKTDENGFILSDACIDKITNPWTQVVEVVKKLYVKHLGNDIHSLYVRGSVARGLAIEQLSDLDTFAVLYSNPDKLDFTLIENEKSELENQYTFLSRIELQFIFYDHLFDSGSSLYIKESLNTRFTIKTQSVCIYGEDLIDKLSPFKIGISTAYFLAKNIQNAIETTKKAILGHPPKEYILEWCTWIMKLIVRNGFILVMDKEQVFTRDLYYSYSIFSKYYVEKEPDMKKALELAIYPTEYPLVILDFLDNFGLWLNNELERKFESFSLV